MAEHTELLAELPLVGRMTTHERLKHAQKRRGQQLKKWAQFEKDARGKKAKASQRKSSRQQRRIQFPENIQLLEAASRNDVEEVQQLLKNGIAPDLYNEDGLTALHQCCIDDYKEIVKLLLAEGADVNACDSELWTPLHAASTCGHLHLVEELIKQGANLLAVNADGNMPYDLCEDDVTLDYIENAMAEQGITQEKIDNSREATERWMIEDVRKLVESGADINGQDGQGMSLLHITAANGYIEAAELLLTHRARVDLKDCDGWEPLHAAACWGQVIMVELLVGNGASLNAKSFLDETPLDVCGDEEVRAKMLDLKHKHDAIVKLHDKHKTALQRRTSSTGSRGKVVRRVSVNERNNMYRKEQEKEAIVWQQAGNRESDPELQDEEDEDRQTDSELQQYGVKALPEAGEPQEQKADSAMCGNGSALPASRLDRSASYQRATREEPASDLNKEKCHHTLADLKRQRAAAKLHNKHPSGEEYPVSSSQEYPVNSDPVDGPSQPEGGLTDTTGDTPEPNSVYFTSASGDPPLIKFKAPVEEAPSEKSRRCCRLM
ncbi:protein phosphatase 1 regulatory subunit 16A [Callorhinchus milii]|uniref:protein phosphatase 1 regulatory subunit 16A n=1 Tax=Callorhinchus milii TaxID=7868 RepID=UPI001C3FDBA8|nr:protein phosphatase 1 regulatory subunit 16A [Callorhinchus milii]